MRSPRLSLHPHLLRVGIRLCVRAAAQLEGSLEALAAADAQAQDALMAVWDRYPNAWTRRRTPEGKAAAETQATLLEAHRRISEINELRGKLQAALDKEH